jgi:negative regulator of replication initiation
MMPTIRIDEDVWRHLQTRAKPFVDTPNDVLRRELKIDQVGPTPPPAAGPPRGSVGLRPDRDYTHLRVKGYRLQGRYVSCHSFREVLLHLCDHLRAGDPDQFDKVARSLRGRKRVYFSSKPDDLRNPELLKGGGLAVETNLNANILVGLCRALLRALGRDPDTFEIDVV